MNQGTGCGWDRQTHNDQSQCEQTVAGLSRRFDHQLISAASTPLRISLRGPHCIHILCKKTARDARISSEMTLRYGSNILQTNNLSLIHAPALFHLLFVSNCADCKGLIH